MKIPVLCICSAIANCFWYPNIHIIMCIYIYLHIRLFRHMKATHFGDVSSRCPFCTNKLTNPLRVWDFVLNHSISPTILTGGQLFLAPPVAPHAWVPQGGTQQKRPGSRKFFVGIQWFWVNFGRFESHLYIYLHLLKFATHPMLPTILRDSRITQQVVIKKDSVIKSWTLPSVEFSVDSGPADVGGILWH